MNKYIVINLNMFSLQNQISIVESQADSHTERLIGSYTLKDLPNTLVTLAHNEDIYDVKIIGGEKYSQLIEYEIGSLENLKFNERKIEIEVI